LPKISDELTLQSLLSYQTGYLGKEPNLISTLFNVHVAESDKCLHQQLTNFTSNETIRQKLILN